MIGLVERCLRDGDDEAWIELWQFFEDASATKVRRILAEHGVAAEDADAVVTRCWQQLTGSGSFFGDENAAVASEPSPPKNVPDPLEPREAVKSLGDENAAVATEPSPLRSMLGKSLREVKQWFVDGTVLCTLKLVEAGKVLLGAPATKKRKRIKPRSHHFESLEPRQMLAVDLLSFQLAEDTGTLGDNVTSNPTIEADVTGDFSGGYVDIEFDNYADGIVEQTMSAYTPGEQISYDPRSFDASVISYDGPFTIRHRTVEYDSGYNVVSTSDWQDFNFTLEQMPDVDI